MKKIFIKPVWLFALVFVFSIFSISISQRNVRLVNERVSITSVDLAQRAQAYCNEAFYHGEVNNGTCDGAFTDPSSRCLMATVKFECVNH